MTVYFVRASESGRIKIGHTGGDPFSRVAALQTGNHERLELVATVAGDLSLEGRLHARFAAFRWQGEWFSANPELAGLIDGIRMGQAVAPMAHPKSLPASKTVRFVQPCHPTKEQIDELFENNRRYSAAIVAALSEEPPP